MKSSYTFLEHTADVLFQAEAPSLGELFEQCGLALQETQVDQKLVESKQKTIISGENKDVESLLFDFLDDLVFYKDSEQLVFNKFKIKIKEKNGVYHMTCDAFGEKLDIKKHNPKVDIKAITMHMFEVKKTKNGWWAQVLVDI